MGVCISTSDSPHDERRKIKRMHKLGYEFGGRVLGRDIDGSDLWFDSVWRHDASCSIAVLAASAHGILIVQQIKTEYDLRSHRRPLASDVLLSFWKYRAEKSIGSLQGVLFKDVENREMRAVREEVYQDLHKAITEPLLLKRDTRNDGRKRAFRRVLRDDCKLGRCVKTLATEYIETKLFHDDVGSVEFMPFGLDGAGFHLKVMLRQRQSNESRRR